jgi:hypothetical protein
MFPSLDIFKIDSGRVLWRGAVETVEAAKARIRQLSRSSPGEYLILNQNNGDRILVTPLTVSTEVASVEGHVTAEEAA